MQIFSGMLSGIVPFFTTAVDAVEPVVDAVEAAQPGAIARFVHMILEAFFSFTQWAGIPSYAVALLLLTIVIKLLLFPLAMKQMRSTRAMQRIQPKLKEIQEKYKSNPQKLQEAQMKLYKEMNFNPLSGCLPLLLQLPIIYMLFMGIRTFVPQSLEFYNFFWITDLSAPDPTGWLLPLLVAGSTALQQFFQMANKKDTMQRSMLLIMPIMMFFFCRSFPSGLALYWVYFGLLTLIQQVFVNRKGKAEDAIEAARVEAEEAEKQRRKNAKKAAKQQYRKGDAILADDDDDDDNDDDEDDDEIAEEAPAVKKWYPPGSPEAEEQARVEEARLKKERKNNNR